MQSMVISNHFTENILKNMKRLKKVAIKNSTFRVFYQLKRKNINEPPEK